MAVRNAPKALTRGWSIRSHYDSLTKGPVYCVFIFFQTAIDSTIWNLYHARTFRILKNSPEQRIEFGVSIKR